MAGNIFCCGSTRCWILLVAIILMIWVTYYLFSTLIRLIARSISPVVLENGEPLIVTICDIQLVREYDFLRILLWGAHLLIVFGQLSLTIIIFLGATFKSLKVIQMWCWMAWILILLSMPLNLCVTMTESENEVPLIPIAKFIAELAVCLVYFWMVWIFMDQLKAEKAAARGPPTQLVYESDEEGCDHY